MAIFASTTTSGYSDPIKALSIKALEQRLKDQQAQMAQQQPDAAMMGTIPGGIGHVLGQVGDRMAQARNEQAIAAQRDVLAKAVSGYDPDSGPPPAAVATTDPELYKSLLSAWAENRRARESNAVTTRGQDVTAGTTTRGQDITARGQDIVAATTARGQDIDVRGQDVTAGTAVRGQDIVAGTAARGQDIDVRGQDLGAQTAARGQDITARGQDVQVRGQDIEQGTATRAQDIAAAAAAADPAKAAKVAELEQQLTQKDLMVNELTRAEEALAKGINIGISGQIATGISKLPGGGYLADKEQGQRTELFDNTMNKVATGAMSTVLKGQSTDFEMKKFIAMYNNPNISIEAKRAAFSDVLAAAKKDRDIEARAVQKVGGDTSAITPPAAAPAGDPLSRAQAALDGGAPMAAVSKLLESMGGDPSKLKPRR